MGDWAPGPPRPTLDWPLLPSAEIHPTHWPKYVYGMFNSRIATRYCEYCKAQNYPADDGLQDQCPKNIMRPEMAKLYDELVGKGYKILAVGYHHILADVQGEEQRFWLPRQAT